MIKQALKLVNPNDKDVEARKRSKLDALMAIPNNLAVYQHRVLDKYRNPDPEEIKQIIAKFKAMYPKETKNVSVFIGANQKAYEAALKRNFNKAWAHDKERFEGRISKEQLKADLLSSMASMDYNRSAHYNPYSNTVHVYDDIGPILAHELGHAVDHASGTAISGAKHRSEWHANSYGMKGYGSDDPAARREYRRVTYPTYSTYATHVPSTIGYVLGHVPGQYAVRSVGAIAARAIAEARNATDLGWKKPDDDEKNASFAFNLGRDLQRNYI